MGILDNFPEHIRQILRSRGQEGFNAWSIYANTLISETGDDFAPPLKWNFGVLNSLQRTAISDLLMSQLDISPADIRAAMGMEGSPFRMIRPVTSNWESGYGSFVVDANEYIGNQSVDDIFAKLMYTTPNVKVIGQTSPRFHMGARYRPEFLKQTAEQVVNAESILKSGKLTVFDIETAGLERGSGMWQLSARLVENGNIGLDDADMVKEFLFDNPNMDMGIYKMNNKPVDFKTFYEMQTRRGNVKWETDFAKAFNEFLDMALESDYVVGQNLAFDIEHILYDIQHMKGGVPDDLVEKLTKFKGMADQGKVIDTQILSEMLFGKTITLDENMVKLGKHTPTSMENILLRTNFLEELSKEIGEDTVKQLVARGAHDAAVDTFFSGHLFRLEMETLTGKTLPEGRQRLRALAASETLADNTMIEQIRKAAAITPFTKIHEMGDIMPVEYLISHTRRLGASMKPLDLANVPFEAGMFSEWADRILDTSTGRLKVGRSLIDSGYTVIEGIDDVGGLQEKAIRLGLPFAGLSSTERLLTTQIGRLSPVSDAADMRTLMGDIAGTSIVEKRKGFQRYAQNLALSPDIIAAAEDAGILTDTNFGAALRGENVLQEARWSVVDIKYADKKVKQGLALVADIFGGENAPAKMEAFSNWLRGGSLSDDLREEFFKQIGLTAEQADELADYILDDDLMKRGVQIGFIDAGVDPEARKAVALMNQLNLGIDSPDRLTARVGIFGASDAVRSRAGDNVLMTGATVIGDMPYDEYLDELARAKDLTEEMYGAVASDSYRQNLIRWGRGRSSDRVRKFYDSTKDLNPRHFALGAAALIGGYYLFRSKNEQDPYDESIDFQGYEDPPPVMPMRRGSQNPLATAGIVQGLDRTKIGHDRMGSDKYDHLF